VELNVPGGQREGNQGIGNPWPWFSILPRAKGREPVWSS
jgi:hypothetical protein